MDLPEAQGCPRHARETKSGSPEIFLLVESGRLGNFDRGIRNGIQDPGLSWIPPYMGRQGDALTPAATRLGFIDDFIYLGLAALLAMKMALRADINKVRLGKA